MDGEFRTTRYERFILALIPFISVIAGTFLTRWLMPDSGLEYVKNLRVENQKVQLRYLEKFVYIGEKESKLEGEFIHPILRTLRINTEKYNANDSISVIYNVPTPKIVTDTSSWLQFHRLRTKIVEGGDMISPNVFGRFESIVDYIDKYPPVFKSFPDRRNPWLNDEEVRIEWYKLLSELKMTVDSIYNQQFQ